VTRKNNYEVLKRIECLVPLLSGGNSEAIKNCNEQIHDPTSLNLNFATIPSKGVCPDEGHMPCDADYRQTLYGRLPAGAVAADCKLCPGTSLIELPAFGRGMPTSSRVCQNGAVFEFTDSWDCKYQDLQKQAVTENMANTGWEASFESCARLCAETSGCSSFNYPKSKLTFYNCWIKTGYKKAVSRSWDCGAADSSWNFFTKIPGVTCTTEAAAAAAARAAAAPTLAARAAVGIGDNFDLSGSRDFALSARIRTSAAAGSIVGKPFANGLWKSGGGDEAKMLFLRNGQLHFDIGWVGVINCPVAVNNGQWHDVAVKYIKGEGDRYQLVVDGAVCGGGLRAIPDNPDTRITIGKAIGHQGRPGDMAPDFNGDIADVSYTDLARLTQPVKAG
jgi:hypothetical protein